MKRDQGPSQFTQADLPFDAGPPKESGSLADADVRRQAREALDRSQLVEASAGTGKTTTLVDRILSLVLTGGVPLPEIAAMTFTEKAAGEIKQRIGNAIEKNLSKAPDSEVLLAARRDLPRAEVGTIHSFAARLIRERPVEAGVDIDFRAPDEAVAGELLDETFDEWVDLEARDESSPLVSLLRAGSPLSDVKRLARELFVQRLVLESASVPRDALGDLRAELVDLAAEFEQILFETPSEHLSSSRAKKITQIRKELRQALEADPAALCSFWRPTLDFSGAGAKIWSAETDARVERARSRLRKLVDRMATFPFEPVLLGLVDRLRESLFVKIEEAKRRRAFLDFDDLLLYARNLLRSSPAAREHFRLRWKAIVVDEFQDTDPVQAEIVFRLAAGEPQDETSWKHLRPRPGALFLVGDPKQSIYRFRRADVETFREARDRFDEKDRLTLAANFRSTPEVLNFVNAVGERLLVDAPATPWEIGYSGLAAGKEHECPRPKPVLLLPPEPPEGEPDVEDEAQSELEARAVARFLLSRRGRDFERFSDVAVLVTRNNRVTKFHEVFRVFGIPAALEGGQEFFRREENAAIVAALRAVDDPSDAISLVATLKSFLFGIADTKLLDAKECGVRFDVREPLPPGSPLAEPFALLLELHRARHERPLRETLLHLLTSRSAFLCLQAGAVPNPIQGVANAERFLLVARQLDAEGLSFKKAVARLTSLLSAEKPEPRAFAEGEDAVRLMTLYAAKGLQFRVVVVADMGLKELERSDRIESFVLDRPDGEWGATLRLGGSTIRTPGYSRILEGDRKRQKAEAKRSLYVALTRAERLLVLSCFRNLKRKKDGSVSDDIHKTALSGIAWAIPRCCELGELDPSLSGVVEVVEGDVSAPPETSTRPLAVLRPAPELDEELAHVHAIRDLARATSARRLRRAGERSEETPSLEDVPRLERESAPASRALRIGVAVHGLMERMLDPASPRTDEAAALRVAGADLDDAERAEALRLARRLLEDPIVTRAHEARRRFVELPILYREPATATLVEGKIDLLFEEDDGWVVVDWKTDRVDSPADLAAHTEAYREQLAAYEAGLRAALGPDARIRESRLVFARAKA